MGRYVRSSISQILNRAFNGWATFWTAPVGPYALAGLRIGFALLFLVQLYWLAPHLYDFYGEKGVIQGQLNNYIGGLGMSPSFYEIYSLTPWLQQHLAYNQFMLSCMVFMVCLAVALMLGIAPRPVAFCLWVTHSCFLDSNVLTNYGLDRFVHIVLFYLSFAPSNRVWTLHPAKLNRGSLNQILETAGLRLIQLHLCLVYFDAGLSKALGSTWWNGEAMWRALMLPEFQQYDLSWMAWAPFVPVLLGWGTVIMETLYPLFIWIPRTRMAMVHTTLLLHLGIALLQGLHLFALAMMIMTGAAFGLAHLQAPPKLRDIFSLKVSHWRPTYPNSRR